MTALNKQALRERYSEKPAPKCHICGAVMTIQRTSAGSVIYGCTGRIDEDGEGYKFEAGRNFADDHYARSRVTEYGPGGDPEVLALLDELEAAERRNAELSSSVIAPGIMRCAGCGFVLTKNSINMAAGTITAGDSKTEPCPNGCGPLWPVTWKEQALEMRDSSEQWFEELQVARQRIAELSASHSKLREGMAAIYNAICENGASTSLSAILTFVKRSREESASAAGIGVKGE